MIKTHAGSESEAAITTAMIELAGELEGETGFPIRQSEPQLGGSQGEEHLIQRGVMGYRFQNNGKGKAAYMMAENVEDDYIPLRLLGRRSRGEHGGKP